jgi:hypothetical protein
LLCQYEWILKVRVWKRTSCRGGIHLFLQQLLFVAVAALTCRKSAVFWCCVCFLCDAWLSLGSILPWMNYIWLLLKLLLILLLVT